MAKFHRRKEEEPYRGEADYQVAHDKEQSFFNDIADAIDNLFTYAQSPVLSRDFLFESDGATNIVESTCIIADNDDASKVNVQQTVRIVHSMCKPPRCVQDYYHITVAESLRTAEKPLLTEYYLEKLPNNHYFGTMRRIDITLGAYSKEPTNTVYGEEEPITFYDVFTLISTLDIHIKAASHESAYAKLLRSHE